MTESPQTEHEPRILIIDDTPANLRILIAMLGKRGFKIHAATDGAQATRFLQSITPDLILLDIRMPGIDGYEVCSRLKKDPRTEDIPVIFLSAIDDVFDKVKAFQCGGVDYIVKPFEPGEALVRIQTQIALRRLRLGLEEEVQKRTQELAKANSLLTEEIRERILAQKAVDQSEHRYRTFFEHNPAGNYIASPDGRLLACNPAFISLFGFSSKEQAMQTSLDLLYPSHDNRCQFIQQIKQHGGLEHYEQQMRHQNGSLLHVVENAVGSFNEHGDLLEVHGFLLDETARKISEHQLRQAQKMEAIGRLASGITHDFNNLLAVILECAETLRNIPPHDHEAVAKVELIEHAAVSAIGLTRQLLAFSRQTPIEPQVLNPGETIDRTSTMLKRLIGENIQLVVSIAPSLGNIRADPIQIEQVLVNLVVNARDAMPDGGSITIKAYPSEMSGPDCASQDGAGNASHIILTVEDTGCGMDHETQSRIFDPFYTTKPAGRGTGLGLSTVYGIVTQNQGRIWVNSELGKGTTFSLSFPRIVQPSRPIKSTTEEHAAHPEIGTVLLVDDSAALREVIQESLKGLGYTVLTATSGPEALQRAKGFQGPIHLLLTDIGMPVMGGPELAALLRLDRPEIGVLFMSGYLNDRVAEHQQAVPGALLIQKPFRSKDLIHYFREIFDRNQTK